MSSVVTPKQKKRLLERPPDDSPEDVLKDRRLNDFYVRKALTRWLDSIEDIDLILEKLPLEQLEKNEILKAEMIFGLFKITEKLVARFNPTPYASRDKEGKYHIYRHFRVDMSRQLLGLTQSTVDIDVVYEPTKEEIRVYNQLISHITELNEMLRLNEQPNEVFTPAELNKKVASIVKGRPYAAKVTGMVGTPTEETAKNIQEGMPLTEAGVPDLSNVDVAKAGLKKGKREETK